MAGWLVCCLAAGWTGSAAQAAPVEFTPLESFPGGALPDFTLQPPGRGEKRGSPELPLSGGEPGAGWQPAAGQLEADHFLILKPSSPVSARQLLAQLVFPGPDPGSCFGRFGIDVTTDAEPRMEGRWMPLILEAYGPEFAARPLPAAPVLVLGPEHRAPFSLILRARAPFDGITGFRLRVFPEHRPGRPPSVGRAEKGGPAFLLGALRIEAELARSTNLALGRQVYCSRQVAEGLPSRHLTDGFLATWSQPQRDAAQPDAFFQLDLGQTLALDHVTVRWHHQPGDGAPVAAFGVELLTESGGFEGSTVWRTSLNPGLSGAADVLRAEDGTGGFAGRRLLIQARGGPGDEPRISEIEVYPALRPSATHWLADGRPLHPDGRLEIPARVRDLSFTPVCPGAPDGVTLCRWRLEGWTAGWMHAAPGQPVHLSPPPAPGTYQLVMEALHSDGQWDTSGPPLAVHAAAPWWRHTPAAAAAISALVLTGGAACWWWSARRIRRRLHRAQQHLELHGDRLRISRDMHDEIGARLTSIALLAERTRRQPQAGPQLLEDLARQARSTVEALDTIVWAVNPRHDTLGGLADYLCDYVPAYLESAGIEGTLDIRTDGPARPLPLTVRHNLLMACKEALQNVVKHSGARHCTVTLTDNAGSGVSNATAGSPRMVPGRTPLLLTITDDGHGFPADLPAGISHTGLESMRQRLAEAGGSCTIQPGPAGRGTSVVLAVSQPSGAARAVLPPALSLPDLHAS